MYKTVEQTAKDIHMSESQVMRYVLHGRMRSVYDGEQFLINSQQFTTYFEQLEQLKHEIDIWKATPIPEDIDIKDED